MRPPVSIFRYWSISCTIPQYGMQWSNGVPLLATIKHFLPRGYWSLGKNMAMFISRWYRAVLKRKITTRPAFAEWLYCGSVLNTHFYTTQRVASLTEIACIVTILLHQYISAGVTFMPWILAWHERKWTFSLFFFFSEKTSLSTLDFFLCVRVQNKVSLD